MQASTLPALGVLLHADHSLAELAALGRLCDGLGYRDFWYTDIRFGRECYLGLATVAAATSRIQLGPGVTDPFTRHPAITAATIATFDELSGGRALLGLGIGGQGFRELGVERRLPVAALRETIEVVRGLWSGKPVDFRGKVVSLAGGRLGFTPVRDRIPIRIATHGPQIARLAGRIADGVLIANVLRPDVFSFYLDRIREGMDAAERSPDGFDVGLRIEACISEDHEAALDVMRRRMAARLIGQYPRWDYLDEMGIVLPGAFVEIARAKDASLAGEAAAVMPDEVVDDTVLAGNAEYVAERLAQVLRPEIGSITMRPHRVPGGSVEAVIEAFANDVMPRVEHRLAGRRSG